MKNEKMLITGGYVSTKIIDIDEHLKELNRGSGVHKTKKGKGSYKRKEKYDKGFCY